MTGNASKVIPNASKAVLIIRRSGKFAEVRDELLIVADVGLKFAYTLSHLPRQWRGNLGKLQIDKEAF